MRKTLCILLLFLGCLSLAGGGTHRVGYGDGPSAVEGVVGSAALPHIDNSSAEQWLCERAANSDLNLPRIPAVHAPLRTLAPQRCGHADPLRALRSAGCTCAAGTWKTASSFGSTPPSAVTHGVDYYVCRLRRLII